MTGPTLPLFFGCGCSRHKVRAGLCSVYFPDGQPRPIDAPRRRHMAPATLNGLQPGDLEKVATTIKILREGAPRGLVDKAEAIADGFEVLLRHLTNVYKGDGK